MSKLVITVLDSRIVCLHLPALQTGTHTCGRLRSTLKGRVGRERSFDPYVVGGVGYYRRTIQFTQPTLVPVTVFDPFFGFLYGVTQANQVLGTLTQDGVGGGLRRRF